MKFYSASQIAHYFLAKADIDVGELISNLKLQKLCYYAQGLTLGVRKQALFDEKIEAWLHGPVIPSLYAEYKAYKGAAIPSPTQLDLSAYGSADRKLLDDVFEFYGQYSAWRLRELTHLESPWKNAYAEGQNNEISKQAMQDFFSTQVSTEYCEKYHDILRSEGQAERV